MFVYLEEEWWVVAIVRITHLLDSRSTENVVAVTEGGISTTSGIYYSVV